MRPHLGGRPTRMKRVSRGAIFWGAALITTGVVVLLIQQGYVDEQLLANAGQWWPLLLIIGVGVAVIFAGVLGSVATALAGLLLGVMVGALISGATSIPASCAGEASAVQALPGRVVRRVRGRRHRGPELRHPRGAGGPGSDWAVQADEQSTQNDRRPPIRTASSCRPMTASCSTDAGTWRSRCPGRGHEPRGVPERRRGDLRPGRRAVGSSSNLTGNASASTRRPLRR